MLFPHFRLPAQALPEVVGLPCVRVQDKARISVMKKMLVVAEDIIEVPCLTDGENQRPDVVNIIVVQFDALKGRAANREVLLSPIGNPEVTTSAGAVQDVLSFPQEASDSNGVVGTAYLCRLLLKGAIPEKIMISMSMKIAGDEWLKCSSLYYTAEDDGIPAERIYKGSTDYGLFVDDIGQRGWKVFDDSTSKEVVSLNGARTIRANRRYRIDIMTAGKGP